MDIGERIKCIRKQRGFSAELIAEKIGVSPSTIYRYENNDISAMKIDKLKLLADFFGISACDLLGWYEDDPITVTVDPDARSDDDPLSASEQSLLDDYRQLNEEGQELAAKQVHALVASGIYIKSRQSGVLEEKA